MSGTSPFAVDGTSLLQGTCSQVRSLHSHRRLVYPSWQDRQPSILDLLPSFLFWASCTADSLSCGRYGYQSPKKDHYASFFVMGSVSCNNYCSCFGMESPSMLWTSGRQPFGPHGPPVVCWPSVGDRCARPLDLRNAAIMLVLSLYCVHLIAS